MQNQSTIIFGEQPTPGQEAWKVPEPSDLPYLTGVDRISLDTENGGINPFLDKVCGISIGWRDEMLNLKTLYTPVAHSEGNMDHEANCR